MTTSTGPGRAVLDRVLLALLVFDGFLAAILAVLYLPLHIGATPAPLSALVAAVVNVALVWGAYGLTGSVGRAAWPLLGWFVGFLLCMFQGPGGDSLLLADWRTLLLLALGVIPPVVLLLKWSADAAVARGRATAR